MISKGPVSACATHLHFRITENARKYICRNEYVGVGTLIPQREKSMHTRQEKKNVIILLVGRIFSALELPMPNHGPYARTSRLI